MAKPGPKPTGVLPRRIHVTPEAWANLDTERRRLARELKIPETKLSMSQAAQIVLMALPSGEAP